MRALLLTVALLGCKEEEVIPTPCQPLFDEIVETCPIAEPADCAEAPQELVECIATAAAAARTCTALRHGIARCQVKHSR